MVAEAFSESFVVEKSAGECWESLTDVPRVSGWVSIVEDVTAHAPLERYTAVLQDRLGPFKLRADLEIDVSEVVEASHIVIRADGEDRQVGSRITVDARLGLKPDGDGCEVTIDGNYEVTGRVATMGASTIRQKATKLLDEFTTAARNDLQ